MRGVTPFGVGEPALTDGKWAWGMGLVTLSFMAMRLECPVRGVQIDAAAQTLCPLGRRPPCYALSAMQKQPTPPHRTSSPWRRRLIVTGIIVGSGGLIWSRLPKGSYPTDLSRIGQGQAVLVLAMDSNYLAGASVMNLLNDLRPSYADSVHFVVASLALPDGQAFANQHQASDGTVVLFDAKGQRVALLHAPQTQGELRRALRDAFGR